jgi:hypothetical protein
MKRISLIMAGVLMALAVVFTCFSCTKKEDAAKNTTKKEAQKITPEQAKQVEEIKKGVKESQGIVIARVNGTDITMHNLVKEMNAIVPKFVTQGQPTTPEITAKVKKKALNNLIFRELAIQEAIKEGLRVKPETIEEVISRVKTQAGSAEGYKKYLEERNTNEDALRKTIERSHLYEGITAREIFDKIKVDDKTLRDAYEKDKTVFKTKDNPPRQLSFEEVKDFLIRKIKLERSAKMIAEWDNELRKKAKIEVMLDEVEKKLQENVVKQKK